MLSANQLIFDANVVITVRDVLSDSIVDVIRRKNLVVTSGLNLVRDLLGGASTALVTHLAIGTGSTAAAATQTVLTTEVFRAALTSTLYEDKKLRVKYFLASTSANGNTLQEAGVFTQSAGGIMFARATHTAIAKTSSISITYDWSINLGAS